jgi:hypothetical protein
MTVMWSSAAASFHIAARAFRLRFWVSAAKRRLRRARRLSGQVSTTKGDGETVIAKGRAVSIVRPMSRMIAEAEVPSHKIR